MPMGIGILEGAVVTMTLLRRHEMVRLPYLLPFCACIQPHPYVSLHLEG